MKLINIRVIWLVSAERNEWLLAHATFYGDMTGMDTMQGACGYGNMFEQGYGLETSALSTALFNNGQTCGACFEIKCFNSTYCALGSITITATNFCPPNYTKTHDIWCNPPQKHFDLSMPMFVKITTDYHVGIVPVMFRRVPCVKKGGIRFQMKGNEWVTFVAIFNVGGAGDIKAVSVKGEGNNAGWTAMTRNWGQVWQTSSNFKGHSLSFMVTTSDGRTVQSLNVVPANWQFNQTFDGSVQF